MNCIVTAGPTFEPLDAVRRLTNFSTGRLGSGLANYLAARGHTVTLLLGQQAGWLDEQRPFRLITFTTTTDLGERLKALADEPVDAVFHAAAVSDFAFGRVWRRGADGALVEVRSGKIPTDLGPLLAELNPTPKIITCLRDWFPTARLVGWKYQVDGDRAAAIQRARQQIADCRTNACVVNGPAYGAGFGFVVTDGPVTHLADAPALFALLEQQMRV